MWFGEASGTGGGGVLARGGVPAGCESNAFSPAALGAALDALDARATPCTIMVEREFGGRLAARGGASAALAAAAARPAPHPPAAAAALCARPPPTPRGPTGWELVLRTTRALAPLDELLVWPDAALRALADVPPLAPIHIRGDAQYVCERCGAVFAYPNPLKMHRYLECAPPEPRAFLRRLLRALTVAPPPPPSVPHPLTTPHSGAALETLCTAWGSRGSTGGHVCVYCGKAYSRRYGLKIHIRTHTGYRPLRCPHCARRFGDPSNLNKHVRLHAGAAAAAAATPQRHQCARCGAVAARRRDLERHARTRHPASPVPAPAPAPG